MKISNKLILMLILTLSTLKILYSTNFGYIEIGYTQPIKFGAKWKHLASLSISKNIQKNLYNILNINRLTFANLNFKMYDTSSSIYRDTLYEGEMELGIVLGGSSRIEPRQLNIFFGIGPATNWQARRYSSSLLGVSYYLKWAWGIVLDWKMEYGFFKFEVRYFNFFKAYSHEFAEQEFQEPVKYRFKKITTTLRAELGDLLLGVSWVTENIRTPSGRWTSWGKSIPVFFIGVVTP